MPLDLEKSFIQTMESLGPFESSPTLAIAVSGGGDSMALALLAQTWAKINNGSIIALTVDHGLRPESAQEALLTAKRLSTLGIKHETLEWRGPKPRTRIQERARHARHTLLQEYCRTHGILHLLFAHTREDQSETIAMRLKRGDKGLSGMRPLRETRDMRLLRPLLQVTRATLRLYCQQHGLEWIEDPSNANPAFERIALRQSMTEKDHFDLHQRAAHHTNLQNQTATACAQAFITHTYLHAQGYATLNPTGFRTLAPEIQTACLRRLLISVSGKTYAPRFDAIERLLLSLNDPNFTGATLGGCRFDLRTLPTNPRERKIIIAREATALPTLELSAKTPALWDQRFLVESNTSCTVKALGKAGCQELDNILKTKEKSLPYTVKLSLPSFWDHDRLLYVPGLLPAPEFRALFTPSEPLCR